MRIDTQCSIAFNRDLLKSDPPVLTFKDHALYNTGVELINHVEKLSWLFNDNSKLQNILVNINLGDILHAQISFLLAKIKNGGHWFLLVFINKVIKQSY